jgi:hypothetical protein
MIIRIIPETDEERAKIEEKTITNVQEFFLFGNNIYGNSLNEFHEWTGSFRYLYGTLRYYQEVLNDERHEAWLINRRPKMTQSLRVIDDIDVPSEVDNKEDDNDGEEKED